MTRDPESNDDLVDEEAGENLTQERMGEGEPRPADVGWGERQGETESTPQ